MEVLASILSFSLHMVHNFMSFLYLYKFRMKWILSVCEIITFCHIEFYTIYLETWYVNA